MQIKDRVFIVTGASSGIGLATAIALSDRGAKVALLARSSDALQEVARKLPGSLPVTVDVTQFDRVREPDESPYLQQGCAPSAGQGNLRAAESDPDRPPGRRR